ncbi:MAG: SMC-Scp complex subunit ScpB [Thermoguttaceae bacterium]|nr:SMC-Scp complex subunit ScpB [Thermoguttaceae bacterium]
MKKRNMTAGGASKPFHFGRKVQNFQTLNSQSHLHGWYNTSKRVKRSKPEKRTALKIKYEIESTSDPSDVIPLTPQRSASKSFTLRVESTGAPKPKEKPVDLKDLATEQARLEAVLFLAKEPWGVRRLAQYAHIENSSRVKVLIEQLNSLYRTRRYAFRIVSVAGGYSLMTRPQFSPWLRRIHRGRETQLKLTPSALETLMIVADKQPVLRVEIESVRGVQCGETLRNLMDRGYIRIVGRSDELGRPFLYGTTKLFLSDFGLNSLNDLINKKNTENLANPDNSVKDERLSKAINSGKSQADDASMRSSSQDNSFNASPKTPAVGATDVTVDSDDSDSESSNEKEISMLHTITDPSVIEMGDNNLFGSFQLGDNVSAAVVSDYNDDEENEDWEDDDEEEDDDWDDEDWDDEDEDEDDDDDYDDEDDEDYDDEDWEEVEDDEEEDDEEEDDEEWDDDWEDDEDEDEDDFDDDYDDEDEEDEDA